MITFCVVNAKVFTTAGYSKAVVVCLVDKKSKGGMLMASIRKRGNSYLITVSCGYDALGKQVRQQMTWTPPEELNSREIKRELDKQAVLFEQEVRCGRVSTAIKFRDFAEQWFEEYAVVRLKRRTYERYKGMIGRVYDAIGHLKVSQMTTRHIQQFISSLSKEGANKTTGGALSPKTVKNYLSMISTIMTYAQRNQIIMMNPCKNVVIPRLERKEIECYTLEQAQKMLELFEQEPQEDLKFTVFFTLAMYSGMRRGELLGLEWQDFDFDTGRVEIVRTSLFSKEIGNYTGTPKIKFHSRVPDMLSHLKIGLVMLLEFLIDTEFIGSDDQKRYLHNLDEILLQTTSVSAEQIIEEQPVTKFCDKLTSLLDSGRCYVETRGSDCSPRQKNCIGLQDDRYYYLFMDSAHSEVRQLCSSQGEHFSISKKELLKQMRKDGILVSRTSRNTISIRDSGGVINVTMLDKQKIAQRLSRDFCPPTPEVESLPEPQAQEATQGNVAQV